MTESGR